MAIASRETIFQSNAQHALIRCGAGVCECMYVFECMFVCACMCGCVFVCVCVWEGAWVCMSDRYMIELVLLIRMTTSSIKIMSWSSKQPRLYNYY